MNNPAWDYLYVYFCEIEKINAKLCSEELSASLTPLVAPIEESDDTSVIEVPAEFLDAHTELLNNLSLCREKISLIVKEKELDYLSSALIFHCDETMLTKTLNALFAKLDCCKDPYAHSPLFVLKSKWPTLQMPLLQCRDGGEQFFVNLQEILQEPTDYALALEVYYFCLKQGFVGQYTGTPQAIVKYMALLADVITANKSKYIPPINADSVTADENEPTMGEAHAFSP